jgi:hypothetical protein
VVGQERRRSVSATIVELRGSFDAVDNNETDGYKVARVIEYLVVEPSRGNSGRCSFRHETHHQYDDKGSPDRMCSSRSVFAPGLAVEGRERRWSAASRTSGV